MTRAHRRRTFAILLSGLLAAGAARAEIHALILTVGEYPGGIAPLKGTQRDAETAAAIARQLGVKDANLTRLRDRELTLTGMRRAFDDLLNRVRPNDNVFLYYSGHGGRQYIETEGRCAESLVTVDANHFLDSELQARLKLLSKKVDKVIVFLDACHSGGVTTRAVVKADPAFTPKYWAKGGANACEKPVNRLTRGLQLDARRVGRGSQNYVVIAAARDNEVSLDQPGRGGVATQAWFACLNGEARDTNGSGALSAEEIRVCAQERVDRALKGVTGYLPHHITISGNPNAVLAFAPKPVGIEGRSLRPVPVSPPHTLADIYHRRDDRRTVTLTPTQPAFRINRDKVEFDLTSSHAGYIYLLMVGSDGKTFDVLFPNQLDKKNYLEAGQTLRLPRTDWSLVAQGPAGKNHLLALVSDTPRNFSGLGLKAAGPFSVLVASPASARDIVQATGTSAEVAGEDCRHPPRGETPAAPGLCSHAYGAALTTVDELP